MPSRAKQQTNRLTSAERKLVSVMFADIVGSSAMVSGCDPEDADRVLRTILRVLTDSVERYGGTIGQMLGDGVLAVFGAPNAQEDHALRACMAAQDIRNAALAFGSSFSVRIGIASGEVLAQVIENGIWSDYRTVGACVHLAAKLQQRAEANTILLAHHTVELVPAGLAVQPVGPLQLAPATNPYPVFLLTSAHARRRTAADLMSAETGPFVGRQRELETLLAAFESAGDGVGTVLLVSGEAGIGKSRLVGEAMRSLGAADHTVLQWPQAPIRQLGEPDDLECVAASLSRLAGDHERLSAVAGQVVGPLARAAMRDLLGLPAEDAIWDGLQAAERLSTAIDALAATTVALSRERPVLTLVEDVHWAGPVMRRFLDALAHALGGEGRILLVATSRPEYEGEWAPTGVEVLRIPLEALPDEPTHELLNRWLGLHPSLDDLKALVAAKSNGVPLYLEESLRALETAGTICGVPGHYRLGKSDRMVHLPPSIHGLLAARIDSLDAGSRRVLLTAAVIGPTFDVCLLRRLEPVPGELLADRLAALRNAGFIRHSHLIPNLEFGFRHGLVQEVAYGTLTREDRRRLHADIFAALSDPRDHDLAGRVELLAHHAFRAEVWTAAYLYGRWAGTRALARSRLIDASQHYTDALTALETMQPTRRNILRRIDLSIALAQVLLPRGVTEVDDQLGKARELALEAGDPIRFARAASAQAAFEWTHGDVDKAIALTREGLAAIEGKDCLDTRIPLLMRHGGILAERGLFAEAAAVLDEGRRRIAFDPLGHHGLTGVAMAALDSQRTRCFAEIGDAANADQAGIEAVRIADESGHAISRVYANGHFGWALLLLGDVERSIPLLEGGLALCELTRSNLFLPFVKSALGYARVMSGDEKNGIRMLEEGSGACTRVLSLQASIWNAEALLHTGQVDRAARAAEEVLRRAGDARRMAYTARAMTVLAEAVAALRYRDADAARLFREAEALARSLSMTPLAERCADGFDRLTARPHVRADVSPYQTTLAR